MLLTAVAMEGGENVTTCGKPSGVGSVEQKLPVVTFAGMPYWARSFCSVMGSNSTCGLMVSVSVPLALRARVKAAVRIVPVPRAGALRLESLLRQLEYQAGLAAARGE